jgi:uncharacterized protein (TIGR03032 family)
MLEYKPGPSPLPFRSVHSPSFPALLREHGISVAVTTYQANKLVLLRADGATLNTHFRDFKKPMGLAVSADASRLALGVAQEIYQFRNVPDALRFLEPVGRHDACFLPRSAHITGDIDIHDLGWAGDELWFVNTRFSCLCTFDRTYSFVPRWRPPFISELSAQDRCHLNGLGMAPDPAGRLAPRYATAHAATDTAKGWRDHKKDGGILLDVESGTVIVGGLAMPHSPRWHDSKLWLLESGAGTLGVVDPAAGRYEALVQLPGFTRGLDFHGNLAFVGLSQVRESAIFSDIPVAERSLAERASGVWVVDTQTMKTVAFLKFQDAVQEVFAVQVLPGRRFPELVVADCPLRAESFDLP